MRIKNLGPIKNATVDFSPLTILCGANNQGKTHLSYTLYGVLSNLYKMSNGFLNSEDYESLIRSGRVTLDKNVFFNKIITAVEKNFQDEKKKILERVFKSDTIHYENTEIDISRDEIGKYLNLNRIKSNEIKVASLNIMLEVNDDDINILLSNTIDGEGLEKFLTTKRFSSFVDRLIEYVINETTKPFYFPAERIGINVFRNQLNHNKVEVLDLISNTLNSVNKSSTELHLDLLTNLNRLTEVYPLPISDYLSYINNIQQYDIDDKSNEISSYIRSNLIKGRFFVDNTTSKSYFRAKAGKTKYKTDLIPLDITSSSIKSIYGLDYFFEKLDDEKHNIVIIDEPEMNLHPSNQMEFANLIDLIISKGIQVVISTHSDFLVKKIQNIIIRNELEDRVDGLNSSNVRVYNFGDSTVKEINLLSDSEPFDNFDRIVAEIEDEYLDLLEQKAAKKGLLKGNTNELE